MNIIQSVVDKPSSEVVVCCYCRCQVRIPTRMKESCGPCSIYGYELIIDNWSKALPPIPGRQSLPNGAGFARPSDSHEIFRPQDFQPEPVNPPRITPQERVNRTPETSPELAGNTALTTSKLMQAGDAASARIEAQPRLSASQRNTGSKVAIAQPFQCTGVYRLNPATRANVNRKNLQAPERQQLPEHQGLGRKRQWGFSLLGAFVVDGLGGGGFSGFKGHQMRLEGDDVRDSRLVIELGY